MTAGRKEAEQAWRAYVLGWLDRYSAEAEVPTPVLRSGRQASPRVRLRRNVCAWRLRYEVGLTFSQIAWALNAYDRSAARLWVRRGAEACRVGRPPGVPDSRQLVLRLV